MTLLRRQLRTSAAALILCSVVAAAPLKSGAPLHKEPYPTSSAPHGEGRDRILQLYSTWQSAITPAYQACLELVHMQSQEVLSSSVLLAKPFHKHWLTSANGRPPRRPGRCNLQR